MKEANLRQLGEICRGTRARPTGQRTSSTVTRPEIHGGRRGKRWRYEGPREPVDVLNSKFKEAYVKQDGAAEKTRILRYGGKPGAVRELV